MAQDNDAVGSKKYLKENTVGITETVNPQYCLCVNQTVISIDNSKTSTSEKKTHEQLIFSGVGVRSEDTRRPTQRALISM